MPLNIAQYNKYEKVMGKGNFQRFYIQGKIAEIKLTLQLAEARSIPFETLLERLEKQDVNANIPIIIDRLCEIKISPKREATLIPVLTHIADETDRYKSREKAKWDSYIYRILKQISPQGATLIAEKFLEHPRKARRQIAIDVFKRVGLNIRVTNKLIELYKKDHEQSYLELIARYPKNLNNVDVNWLLSEIKAEYWRARVIEGIIKYYEKETIVMAKCYPFEFVHAVGRTRSQKYLKIILELYEDNKSDIEFISIFTWCLGVLRLKKYLYLAKEAINQIEDSLKK